MKPTEHKIRVLIADDHTTVLAGLASIIGMQPDMVVVAEAANGRQAVELWLKHRPEITLLDIRMPILDGVAVVNEIRQQEAAARGDFEAFVGDLVVIGVGDEGQADFRIPEALAVFAIQH